MSAAAQLGALARSHPEWAPWLRVVAVLIDELANPAWDVLAVELATAHHATPASAQESSPEFAPLLAGAVLRPDGPALASLFDRLADTARAQGLHAVAGDRPPQATSAADALAVFLAAVNGNDAVLDLHAARLGAAPEGFRALAQLLPMPCLHSCARRWAAGAGAAWSQGYCPICGAWPALAELRGIARSRHLRCGRCGAGWPMPVLACTYCANTDHETLGTLVVDDRTARFTLDVCRACSGYIKSCATLQPTPSNELLYTDLASVEFDLAALERGFLRPPGPGAALGVSLGVSLVAAEPAPAPPPAPRRLWSRP